MTAELLDVFHLLAPTRSNFASVAAAVEYYEPRAVQCREAERLMRTAARLARSVCTETAKAVDQLAKLTAAEQEAMGLGSLGFAPAELIADLEPRAVTFLAAAAVYARQADVLETALAALRAAL